jgi:uncharacterized membrane protein
MVALRRALLAGSIGWACLLPLASFAASRPAPARWWYTAAFLIYGLGGVICHQLPERSFELWSAQMPVCARCTGIYAGAAVAACLVMLRSWVNGRTALTSLGTTRTDRAVLAMATVPTVVTLVFEWTTGVAPSNAIRAAAGVPLGAAVILVMLAAFRDAHDRSVGPLQVRRGVN